jgi:uncharacterized protein
VTAHFPGRAVIDSYGGGGFGFAEMSHRGSILALPSGIYAWKPDPLALTPADFAMVLAEKDAGRPPRHRHGPRMARPPRPVREALDAAG